MNSLQKLLSQEGLEHSKYLKSRKQEKLGDKSMTMPIYICHDKKNLDSLKKTTDKASTQKDSSIFSSKRVSSDSERINSVSLRKPDEPAIDEVAVRAVISILGGYIGRYVKDLSFREMIRHKCNSCMVRKRKDLDDGFLSNIESGMESIEKLVQVEGTRKEVKMKLLRNSIQQMSIVASLKSKKSRNGSTYGIPNSHISACAQLYLAIVYKIEENDRISARHLLQVFSDSPFLARTHLLPDLWEYLFLPHLLHLKIWYHKELETLSNSQKENRIKTLTKAYNEYIDMGTIQFALYYQEWLQVGGKAPPVPVIPLPSRHSSATSRKRSLDSNTSNSSFDRNLYRAVFEPENLSVELNDKRRDSKEARVTGEKVNIEEDEYNSSNYVTRNMRTYRRSTSQEYRSSRNELWPERLKSSHHFGFFTCKSVVSECLVKSNHIVRSNSINSVESIDLPSNDLSRAISTISTSDSLTDCETAIRVITKSWLESQGNAAIESALSKASIVEGILEVLFASDDDEILELAISILSEVVSRNETNRLIILNSDPQLEIFVRLLKSSSLFLKAAVLLYQLKPKAKQMISIDWIALALRVLEFGDQLQTLFSVRCIPQEAALYFLGELLTGFSEDKNMENASQVVSLGGLSFLVRAFEKGNIDDRNNVAMLMSCCIRADGSCRNYLAENVSKCSLLELIALGIQKKPTGSAFTLLTDLVCLNGRKQILKFLTELSNGWVGLNTKHIFLVYLQRALPEERPLVAAILLQLDLLGDPLRSSLYREDAVEAIIEALDSQVCNSKVQDQSAKALLMLGSHFSPNGEATSAEWLLQQTGCHDRSVDLSCSKQLFDGNPDEEEKAMEDWRRKVAIVLLNTGSKRFLAAISNSIANGTTNLAQSCLLTIAWMNRVLHSIEDETFQYVPRSVIASELKGSSNCNRALRAGIIHSELRHLIKSSECVSILSALDKELIDPLRHPW